MRLFVRGRHPTLTDKRRVGLWLDIVERLPEGEREILESIRRGDSDASAIQSSRGTCPLECADRRSEECRAAQDQWRRVMRNRRSTGARSPLNLTETVIENDEMTVEDRLVIRGAPHRAQPKLTPADIRRILARSATRLGPGERDDNFGAGLIDPLRVLQLADPRTAAATPPPASKPTQQ
jgi:hypothetical protein